MRGRRRGAQSASHHTLQAAYRDLNLSRDDHKPTGLYPVTPTQDLLHPLSYNVFAPEQLNLVDIRKRLMDQICISPFYSLFAKQNLAIFDENTDKSATSFSDYLVSKQIHRFPMELRSSEDLNKPKKRPKIDKDQAIGQVKTLIEVETHSVSSHSEAESEGNSSSSVSIQEDSQSEGAASEASL